MKEEQKLKSLSEKDAGVQDNETGEETNEGVNAIMISLCSI